MFYGRSPLIGSIAVTGANARQYVITFDPTQPRYCTNITATGTQNVAGTLSGAGITNMLSPYALTSSITSYFAGTGIVYQYPTIGIHANQVGISIDPTQQISCAGLASSAALSVTSGGATITGNSTITGTLNTGQFQASGQISNTAGGLSIIGTSSITESLTSTTLSTGGNAGIAGNATVGGTLVATGTVTAGSAQINSTGGAMLQPTSTANVCMSCQGNWTASMTYVRCVYGSTGRIDIVANSAGVSLAAGANSWTAASDERLKDVTGTYDTALGDI